MYRKTAICQFLLFVIVAFGVESALAQAPSCSGTWGTPIVNQTFGQGNATDVWYGPLATYAPGVTTSTVFVGAAGPTGGILADGQSGLAKVPAASAQGNWVDVPDHTGDPNGLIFLINAPSTAATIFFEYTMDDLCPNTTLKLSVWMLNANIGTLTSNPTYQYPNMTIQAIDPVTGNVLASTPSGDVPADSSWHEYSLVFNNGANSSVTLQLVNNSVGSGYGNDLAIDDITVQPCVPVSEINPSIDTLICQSATLDFSANVINPPYSPTEYQWQYSTDGGATWVDDGPPTLSNSYTFNANTANSGDYLLRFKAGPQGGTGSGNCIAISDTSLITVSDPPVPPVILYESDYCVGQTSLAFNVVSGVNLKWYDSISGGVGDPNMPDVSTAAPGHYKWYVSQTTAQGCESDRTLVEITVHAVPHAQFSYEIGLGCSGDTVKLHNESTGADHYLWRFGVNGPTDTATHTQHVFTDAGTYAIVLVAENQYCVDSMVEQITLGHPLLADFTTSADTICVGSQIDFTNTSTTTTVNGIDPSYYWDYGDGDHDTLQHPSHIFHTAGIFPVRLVVRNGVPCTDTMTRWVYVDSIPQIAVTLSDTVICQGDEIVFRADITQNGLQHTVWRFGDTPDSVANHNPVTHAYETPGTYPYSLQTRYRVCPDASLEGQVIVKPVPTIYLGPDTSICLDGQPYLLGDFNNQLTPGASWVWNTGDTTASIWVKHHGTYQATVNIDGCKARDEVVIAKDCYLDIPNSFTPNADGSNDYFFPRQFLSSGVVYFEMTIWNRWGQVVFQTNRADGRGWDGRFNEKDQPMGVYVYQIKIMLKNQRTEQYSGNVTLLR